MTSIFLALSLLRPIQWSEKSGLEENLQQKAELMAYIIHKISESNLVIWITASQDISLPFILVGIRETLHMRQLREPLNLTKVKESVEFLANVMELGRLWEEQIGSHILIEIVDEKSVTRQEWETMFDREKDIEKSIPWMTDWFLSNPWDDIEPAGLEENQRLLEIYP